MKKKRWNDFPYPESISKIFRVMKLVSFFSVRWNSTGYSQCLFSECEHKAIHAGCKTG